MQFQDLPMDVDDVRSLVECRQPLLIGIRHHSAAMARAVVLLLEKYRPECLLLELPPEFLPWIPHLSSAELRAPIALAASSVSLETRGLSFYPFADFSPELAAVRWCAARGIPVVPFDLPLAWRLENAGPVEREPSKYRGLLARLIQRTGVEGVSELWETMVESPAAGLSEEAPGVARTAGVHVASAEAVRRAALLFGWALRCNDGLPDSRDLRRETYMRRQLAAAPARSAAVIGSYHASALLPSPLLFAPREIPQDPFERTIADNDDRETSPTALVPYSFSLMDERSGYPAGVRDPLWRQRMWESASPEAVDRIAAEMAVDVCRHLRAAGHAAAAADCQEIMRVTRDLARLRGYPAPGRRELIEAIQTCLTQGQLLGRGAAVARALQHVMIGDASGRLPDAIPPSGLAVELQSRLKELRLPLEHPVMKEPKRMRLDPMRSRLDRARVALFHRLRLCNVDYASPVEGETYGLRENLTEIWEIRWKHTTTATVAFAASFGATIQQAAMGCLRRLFPDESEMTPGDRLAYLEHAANCGLQAEVLRGFQLLDGAFLHEATLSELAAAIQQLERVRCGHNPGLPLSAEDAWTNWLEAFTMPGDVPGTALLETAIGRLEGLGGSEQMADVVAVADLVLAFQQQSSEHQVAGGRLIWNLQRMSSNGSGLMQGAGLGAQLLLGVLDDEHFGKQLGSWVDAAVNRESHRLLRERLSGAVVSSISCWSGDSGCFQGLEQRIAEQTDDEFLSRLPAIRGGFQEVSPAARDRLLHEVLERLPDHDDADQAAWDDPVTAAWRLAADEAGREAVAALLPDLQLTSSLASSGDAAQEQVTQLRHTGQRILLADRWRLMLGAPREDLASELGLRCASALDELYGDGCGERRRARSGKGGATGGQGAGFPNIRRWSEELEDLFGRQVREEVLGQAAAKGRAAAIELLDPDEVTPSVGLLQQVLSLRGSLPAGRDEHLRKLASRVTEDLAKQLATRLRPALAGLSTPRPTRRPTNRLDLRRTIQANLRTATLRADGTAQLTFDRMVFRSRARRSMDWHVVFIVDISGSMEPSVVYSALVAAILNALPALSVQFLAFNTEVLDFTSHVDDPLSMLLEVEVGGGTHIAKGLHAARQRLVVPSRSIVLLVTDFEEGGSVSQLMAEVEAMGETGATMLGLAALSDEGAPRYHQGIAQQCVMRGMPVAALSPLELARWVGEQMQ